MVNYSVKAMEQSPDKSEEQLLGPTIFKRIMKSVSRAKGFPN